MSLVSSDAPPRIAVLIPCYNEAITVAQVVHDFRRELPDADIYVFDNNSTDDTARLAQEAGAIVRSESLQGKGNVVRNMFRNVEADCYVMVDGDCTYPADRVHDLIRPVLEGRAEMVVGDRLSSHAYDAQNTRPMHGFGNRLVRRLINWLYGSNICDVMTGYRVFSRMFVKTAPILSNGFEVETEMTLHALDKRLHVEEIPIEYLPRPEGSESKLDTVRDGLLVLRTITSIVKYYKPLRFFGGLALLFAFAGVVAGSYPVLEYLHYSYVYKVPMVILAGTLELMAMLSLSCGLILDSIVRLHKERYLLQLNAYVTAHLSGKTES
ncbi:MAG: glycosyltransferase family 2 protein [Desulfovibrio sp.]|uniref:glycosyltransferase family 2 protein n=1 Tax=Desulfovibrio sp. 7SRBS1 TaxID=3378064 RepID=UPI003B41EEE7